MKEHTKDEFCHNGQGSEKPQDLLMKRYYAEERKAYKEEFYRLGKFLGNSLNDLQRLMWLSKKANGVVTEDASPILDGPTKPDTCPYEHERTVIRFFGLPETVQEGDKVDADFGILVNLVAVFDEERQAGWIDASQQQPAPYEEVLGWLKHKECIGIVYYNEHSWWHEVHDEVAVTRWMPLPAPPNAP